eukprot:3491726-Amphidinium_carterae.1
MIQVSDSQLTVSTSEFRMAAEPRLTMRESTRLLMEDRETVEEYNVEREIDNEYRMDEEIEETMENNEYMQQTL